MNKIKLFLENKGHGNPRAAYAYTCIDVCVRINGSVYAARVPEAMKDKFFLY